MQNPNSPNLETYLATGELKMLSERYKVSKTFVYDALRFRSSSTKAIAIRTDALKMIVERHNYLPTLITKHKQTKK